MSKLIAKAYAKRTGKSMAEVEKMMDVETYLFGDEMVDHGFIDSIITTEAEKDPETARALACVALQGCNDRMSADISAVKQDLAAASRLLMAMSPPPKKDEKEPSMKEEKELFIPNASGTITSPQTTALEEARQAGITAERQRIAECRAIPALGHQALVDSMIEEGKQASEIAMAIVSAENSLRVAAAAALLAEAPPVVPAAEAGAETSTMKRAAFANLTPQEQSAFAKSGGLIVD